MNFGNYQNRYHRNLELGFIITLGFLIGLFHFYPNKIETTVRETHSSIPAINIIDIPRTTQARPGSPKPILPSVLVPDDEPEIPDEVYLPFPDNNNISGLSVYGNHLEGNQISLLPKQIVEVIPELSDLKLSGYAELSLRINIEGRVVDYKIKINTTNSEEFLKRIISAAEKSRWQPAKYLGKPVECWIDKSYKVN